MDAVCVYVAEVQTSEKRKGSTASAGAGSRCPRALVDSPEVSEVSTSAAGVEPRALRCLSRCLSRDAVRAVPNDIGGALCSSKYRLFKLSPGGWVGRNMNSRAGSPLPLLRGAHKPVVASREQRASVGRACCRYFGGT